MSGICTDGGILMDLENRVLCASSAYEEKYYFNEFYAGIPSAIQDELKIMCVQFTEDVGGILSLEYDEEGSLLLSAAADEGDLLYDEIGSGLKIRQLQRTKNELFEALETYYKVFILKQDLSDILKEQ